MKINKYLNLLTGLFLVLTACTNTNTVNNPEPASSAASPSPGSAKSPSPGSTATPSPNSSAATATGPVIAGGINESEPNDNFDAPMKITLNKPVSVNSTIGDKDIDDYYEINIPTGSQDGTLKLNVNNSNPKWAPDLIFFNSEKTTLNNLTADDKTITNWENSVSAGHKYFLQITGAPDIKTSYGITLQFTPVPDLFEPNNSFAEAKDLQPGKAVDIYLYSGPDSHADNSNLDEDYFKLAVPDGTTNVKVSIENKSGSEFPQNFSVELFDPDQSSFGSRPGDYAQANVSTDYAVETAGEYYLKVSAGSSVTASKLTVTLQ